MKHLLLTTIAAVLLVGCGESQPTVKAPDISIHAAAKAGNVEAVRQLLAAGADANDDAGFGMPPLQNAAAFGHKEVAELLIENGADVNYRNPFNITPLDQASMLNFTDTIDLLRKYGGKTGGELWAEESILGAAGIGDIGLVKKHLSGGADVMQRDDMKATSLHHSVTSEVAALLIKNGANVNAKDIGGQTPLHEAVNTGILKVAELLITKGADVNAKDESEDTPLHKATRKNNHEMIELLISKGAAINPKDGFGETPLNWAILLGQTEIADSLRKHGGKTGEELKAAEPTTEVPSQQSPPPAEVKPATPVAEAANSEADRMLFAHIIAAKNWNQWNINRIKIDFEDGADVNAKDDQGATPLHYAAYRGHKEIVELLISKGADLNTKDDNGETPLYQAEEVGLTHIGEVLTRKKEIADLLRKHGGKTSEELKAEGK